MTITQFITGLVSDYHRPNLYSCFFDPPFIPLNKVSYSSILVRTAQLPGQTINLTDTYYNNKKQNFASSIDLDPVSFDFYCDTGNSAHSFILEWMNNTISSDTRILNYKLDYAGTVEIDLHSRPLVIAGVSAVNAKLINAFPINISPVELSSDGENDICKFTASFVFEDFQYTFPGGFVSSLRSFGVGAAGAVGLI